MREKARLSLGALSLIGHNRRRSCARADGLGAPQNTGHATILR
jgi:hypothetical protein